MYLYISIFLGIFCTVGYFFTLTLYAVKSYMGTKHGTNTVLGCTVVQILYRTHSFYKTLPQCYTCNYGRENAMTNKMKMFCLEYMKDFNGAEAARRAGYSKKTARTVASENLTKPDIKAEIEKLKKILVNDKDKIILENIIFWQTIRNDVKSKDVDRLRASEHLGRYAAMFTETIVIENMTIGKPPSLEDAEFPE